MSPAHINKQIMARLEAIEKILAEVAAKLAEPETNEPTAAKRGPGRPPKNDREE